MALLNLTNFDDHPGDPNWMVFRFADREMAHEFITGLEEAGIAFEADLDDPSLALIGVKQRYRDAAIRINYVVLGRHRRPFIGDGLLRWALVGMMALLVALAIIGWLIRS